MPSLRICFGLMLMCLSPLGFAAQNASSDANPVKAPEQPSAALLEFIGDWNEDERQLIGMDTKNQKSAPLQDPKEVRSAP
ncbi:MAG: hypothetical protein V4650_07130 [Pseudomonadota bacterium]